MDVSRRMLQLAAVLAVALFVCPHLSGAQKVLQGMPEYLWYYGCSPTAGGMLVGYWDTNKPGYQNLYDGDASVWFTGFRPGPEDMVASEAHITSGFENGDIFGSWRNCPSYPDHEDNPDCIADFMKTVGGKTKIGNIALGLEAYVEWDNPDTAVNESYQATIARTGVPSVYGDWTYDRFRAEIDAGRPVLFGMLLYLPQALMCHGVAAYGYRDDMYTIRMCLGDEGGYELCTVPGFTVMDTWCSGAQFNNNWVAADGSRLLPTIDADGVEWWPYVEYYGANWAEQTGDPTQFDWSLDDAITLDIEIPEPLSASLLALACPLLLHRRRRSQHRPDRGDEIGFA